MKSTISRRHLLKMGAGTVAGTMIARLASGAEIISDQPGQQEVMNQDVNATGETTMANSEGFPFIIIRLHPRHHTDKKVFAEVLSLLKKYRDVCNEVWLCTEGGFPRLEQHRESAAKMAEAADEFRKLGILPGMQIGNTIGHAGTYMQDNPDIGTHRLVGHDGIVAGGCNCPRDEQFLDYQRQLAGIYSEAAHPSSIWIDDDLRMNSHHPVSYGCFCEKCLAGFSRLQGHPWNREELIRELVKPGQYSRLRQEWVEFCVSGMAEIARVISEAAVRSTPLVRLGLQQCSFDWSTYYGPDMNLLFSAMEKETGRKPGSRLGHGYYSDHAPRGVLVKGLGIARQVERSDNSLEQICPEVENYYHTSMGKSPRGTAIEAALHLAMGCNSLSFALWNNNHVEGTELMERLLKKFRSWLPFWEMIASFNKESSLGGLDLAFGRHHVSRPLSKEENPWDSWDVHSSDVMQISALGLPLCPDSPLASASLLTAEAASGLTDEELKVLFSGGVLMDGETVVKLKDRKPGFELGVSAEVATDFSYELLSDDPLNGNFTGMRWKDPFSSCYKLFFDKTPRVLGELKNHEGKTVGYSTAVFENELGGRVGVLGYNLLKNVLISSAKRWQLLQMADWISDGKLPALLETSAQVMVCPRLDKKTGFLKCLTLLNTSIGETEPLLLYLRHSNSERVTMYSPEGKWKTALKARPETNGVVVNVPSISPWGIVFLTLG